MRVGDYIRSGQFSAADDLAGALLRDVAGSPNASNQIHIALTGKAGQGLSFGWVALCGARDAGHVDPSCAELIDDMLSEVEGLMQSQGGGSVSRFGIAYCLANLTLLLPGQFADASPAEAEELAQSFGEIADVFQVALEESAGAPASDRREGRDQGGPPDERPAPMIGAEYGIPWPTPLPPGCSAMSFRGAGNQVSQEFVLLGDAALRIAAESGPFTLRVCRPDGSVLSDVANLPDGGLGLMAIPEGGTYTLEIETPARWGVTVVFERGSIPGKKKGKEKRKKKRREKE